jgi:magnesium transporter
LPWLLINLGTAFAAAFVVGLFDETIARFTALAVLLPIVAGQSGNTGAQALAVTSRGLALREIRTRHWFRVLSKEMIASVGNGIAVAVVTAGAVMLFSGSVGIAAVIGVSMVISMLMAAISGAMIPVLLTALGRDPATASSIILTTVTDIAGFFSFLGLATMFVEFLG